MELVSGGGFFQRCEEAVSPGMDVGLADLMTQANHAPAAFLGRHF